eukprot:GFYU01007734.1.p1 GENE.GFYU01007734.1~~GFYU01007734.1.p1  ORF type:complete len:595 (-),score=188.43 GFYU01007734.1:275-2059(-)
MPTPELQFVARGREGTRLWWGGKEPKHHGKDLSSATSATAFSKDGELVCVVSKTEVDVFKTETTDKLITLERKNVVIAEFSPDAKHLVTWERVSKENTDGNLIIWNLSSGEVVTKWSQKHYTGAMWSGDGQVCLRQVNNEIHLYDPKDFTKYIHKLRVEKVAQVAISPSRAPYHVACFIPEVKGAPAQVRVLEYHPSIGKDTQVAAKSFYKAQKVELMWNLQGTALLITAQTEVDTSGKSYYGETSLFFMGIDGTVVNVPLSKEGPIHDVQWSPSGREFVVCYGFMPAKSTLYNFACKPLFEFGEGSRNTIRWAPHSRFLLIGGFGNLQGDVDLWDRNKLKKLGNMKADCAVSYEWSPCSRYLLTATLFPRLRVDNSFTVWTYYGEKLFTESYKELYEVAWKPVLPDTYPDRPQSPHVLERSKEMAAKPAEAAAAAKPQAYRHPNAKRDTSWMFAREEDAPKKVTEPYKVPGASGARVIPGLVPGGPGTEDKPSKSALKNKKKREAKLKKAEEESAATSTPAPAQPAAPKKAEDMTPEEAEKKLKALNKKLRQIDSLKEKKAAGETLEETQVQKLASEGDLKKEAKALEAILGQ